MKWIATILLAANLAVAAYFIGPEYWPQTPRVDALQISEGPITLGSHAVSSPRVTAHRPAPPAEPPLQTLTGAMCLEWRGLDSAEFIQVREQLKGLAGERVMSFIEVPLVTRHWVYLPPLPSPESAAELLADLAAAGVSDTFVVKEGTWRNAISLGLYSNGESAHRRVREVESRGVVDAQIEIQPRQGTDFYFVIRSEDPDALKSLSEIKRAYPNSQQSRVACPS